MDNSIISKPKDLAEEVFHRIQNNTLDKDIVSLEVIEKLFECLFYASLHSEEGELIRVSVTFFDPINPRLKEKKILPTDNWEFVQFFPPLSYSVSNLVKLAKAADPWSSSLAVFQDENNDLYIHGMLDQAIHSQSWINYEADQKPEQPGYFRATIDGIGHISVMTEYELIATLKQDKLITDHLNVFQTGPVSEIIKRLARSTTSEIKNFLKRYAESDMSNWYSTRNIICRTSISRILNKIKSYHHGGALLFTDETEDLKIKYNIKYDRLRSAMANLINAKIGLSSNDEEFLDEDAQMPVHQHLEIETFKSKKVRAANELKGAIRFIASQSCVDGLVLIDMKLRVAGFGVVIDHIEIPEYIFTSDAATPNQKKLEKVPTNRYGTRHRSMFGYCNKYPGSLGFVISQDGDIRAIANINDQLIMWENIQTQKTLRSSIFTKPKLDKLPKTLK